MAKCTAKGQKPAAEYHLDKINYMRGFTAVMIFNIDYSSYLRKVDILIFLRSSSHNNQRLLLQSIPLKVSTLLANDRTELVQDLDVLYQSLE